MVTQESKVIRWKSIIEVNDECWWFDDQYLGRMCNYLCETVCMGYGDAENVRLYVGLSRLIGLVKGYTDNVSSE